jgi:hypothetical protein
MELDLHRDKGGELDFQGGWEGLKYWIQILLVGPLCGYGTQKAVITGEKKLQKVCIREETLLGCIKEFYNIETVCFVVPMYSTFSKKFK